MKKIVFTIAFVFTIEAVFAQQSDLRFIESNQVIEDLKNKGVDSDFYSDLDYDALLYLHPETFDLLVKLKPKWLHLTKYEENSVSLREFRFNSKEIKDLFENREKLRQVINLLSPETDYEYSDIYLSSPDKAFFTIYGNMWSNSYGFHLEDGKLKLEYEINTIE